MTAIHQSVSRRVSDLVVVLDRLADLHGELQTLLCAKLEAMRRADHETINRNLAGEQACIRRIEEQDGLRKQLMMLVGHALGLSAEESRILSIRRLAERLSTSNAERLTPVAGRLREAVESVAGLNRMIGIVSRDLLSTLGEVFDALKTSGDSVGIYGESGRVVLSRPRELFAMVG